MLLPLQLYVFAPSLNWWYGLYGLAAAGGAAAVGGTLVHPWLRCERPWWVWSIAWALSGPGAAVGAVAGGVLVFALEIRLPSTPPGLAALPYLLRDLDVLARLLYVPAVSGLVFGLPEGLVLGVVTLPLLLTIRARACRSSAPQ